MIAAPSMGRWRSSPPIRARPLRPPMDRRGDPTAVPFRGRLLRALYHLGGVLAQSVGRVYGELWREVIYAGLVIAGALSGRATVSRGGRGVTAAILYMFVASANLALRATGATWRTYLRVQRSALASAVAAAAVALSVRLLFEAAAAQLEIAVAASSAAAVPGVAGILWTLSSPAFEPLLASRPHWGTRLETLA